jgi:hypothetical protein
MKRTPLARSRKPLPRRSAKTEAKYAGPDGRRALVARLLSERPVCESGLTWQWVVCKNKSVDIHEVLSRARGGSILDESNLLAVCRHCHTWITDRPLASERLGLSRRRWPKGESK